jgi:hypothetical protein
MSETLSEQEAAIKTRIVDSLRTGIVKVVFTKSDGTERTMRCTLVESYLPPKPEEGDAPAPKRKRPPSMIPVWDVDKEGWRSFNIGSVISWQTER